MNNEQTNNNEPANEPANTTNQNLTGDLQDNEHDAARMQQEEVTLDLPDVSDIPGQENVLPPRMEELADTTIASDDEEGIGVFGDEETLDDDEDADTTLVDGNDADVSQTEKDLLQRADEDMPTEDENNLRAAALDNTDMEGEPLNEESFSGDVTGADLDTSGTDFDDPMENIGEEDEENNTYSLGDDDNDNVVEGTP